MLENKSDVEKNASEQKCCGKVPVQNMGGVILDIDGTVLDSMSIWQDAGVRYLASQRIEAEPGLARRFIICLSRRLHYICGHAMGLNNL